MFHKLLIACGLFATVGFVQCLSPPGPHPGNVCPCGWSQCVNSADCGKTGCCAQVSHLFPSKCCVIAPHVAVFRSAGACSRTAPIFDPNRDRDTSWERDQNWERDPDREREPVREITREPIREITREPFKPQRIGNCPPRGFAVKGALNCPRIQPFDECRANEDCPDVAGTTQLCCPTDSKPGCYVGYRCTAPILYG